MLTRFRESDSGNVDRGQRASEGHDDAQGAHAENGCIFPADGLPALPLLWPLLWAVWGLATEGFAVFCAEGERKRRVLIGIRTQSPAFCTRRRVDVCKATGAKQLGVYGRVHVRYAPDRTSTVGSRVPEFWRELWTRDRWGRAYSRAGQMTRVAACG